MVQNLKDDALYLDAPSLVYWPAFMQNAFGGSGFATPALAFVVRSDRTGTATLNNEIREAVWSVNRDDADRARAHDAEPLRGIARANVIRARDAGDRGLDGARARAQSGSTA